MHSSTPVFTIGSSLGWLNYWSAPAAKAIGFPGALRGCWQVTDELFAVGVMLYELLTVPLPAKNPPRLDCAEGVSRLRPAREVNPRVPEAFSALVEDLLAHDPAQRPVNFEALRRRLMELVDEETTATTDSSGP